MHGGARLPEGSAGDNRLTALKTTPGHSDGQPGIRGERRYRRDQPAAPLSSATDRYSAERGQENRRGYGEFHREHPRGRLLKQADQEKGPDEARAAAGRRGEPTRPERDDGVRGEVDRVGEEELTIARRGMSDGPPEGGHELHKRREPEVSHDLAEQHEHSQRHPRRSAQRMGGDEKRHLHGDEADGCFPRTGRRGRDGRLQ